MQGALAGYINRRRACVDRLSGIKHRLRQLLDASDLWPKDGQAILEEPPIHCAALEGKLPVKMPMSAVILFSFLLF